MSHVQNVCFVRNGISAIADVYSLVRLHELLAESRLVSYVHSAQAERRKSGRPTVSEPNENGADEDCSLRRRSSRRPAASP